MSTGWCILRMAGPRTLAVTNSLAGAGFEAWTPCARATRRRPRSKERIDIEAPIAPTFAFVRGDRLADLRLVSLLPVSPHPPFSIMQHSGRIPLVSDREIAGLRAAEEKSAAEWAAELRRRAADQVRDERDAQRRQLTPGAAVTVKVPAFFGITGVVIEGNRKGAWVDLGGSFRMKIDTWLLAEDEVRTAMPA